MDTIKTGYLILIWLLAQVTAVISIVTMVASHNCSLIHHLHIGDTFTLPCQFVFKDFDVFDNPIIWEKQQFGEVQRMNNQRNLEAPFLGEGRFAISKLYEDNSSSPAIHKVNLTISDIKPNDSGNYTCQVRGHDAIILDSITHQIMVSDFVKHVYITTKNESFNSIKESETKLNFTEGKDNMLSCMSEGGYPAPEMHVIIKCEKNQPSYDMNEILKLEQNHIKSGIKGLQEITYHTKLWSDKFDPGPKFDGCDVTCAVNVHGGKTDPRFNQHQYAQLHVNYAPRVICYNSSALPGDTNVHVTCDANAKPGVTHWGWIISEIDEIGEEIVHENQGSSSGYWTFCKNLTDHKFRYHLYMRVAEISSFRSYTIFVENKIAKTTGTVTLVRKISPTLPPPRNITIPMPRFRQSKSENTNSANSLNSLYHKNHNFVYFGYFLLFVNVALGKSLL